MEWLLVQSGFRRASGWHRWLLCSSGDSVDSPCAESVCSVATNRLVGRVAIGPEWDGEVVIDAIFAVDLTFDVSQVSVAGSGVFTENSWGLVQDVQVLMVMLHGCSWRSLVLCNRLSVMMMMMMVVVVVVWMWCLDHMCGRPLKQRHL